MDSGWVRLGFFLGLSQGVAWTVLSLTCIIVRNMSFEQLFFQTGLGRVKGFVPYKILVEMLMWYLNLDPQYKAIEDELEPYYYYIGLAAKEDIHLQETTPFFIFVCIMFVLSIIWAVLSVLMTRNVKYMKWWVICTGIVLCVDLILMIISAANYVRCIDGVRLLHDPMQGRDDEFPETEVVLHGNPREVLCATGILPVLVIAGRGFTLWVINLIIGVIIWNLRNDNPQEVAPIN